MSEPTPPFELLLELERLRVTISKFTDIHENYDQHWYEFEDSKDEIYSHTYGDWSENPDVSALDRPLDDLKETTKSFLTHIEETTRQFEIVEKCIGAKYNVPADMQDCAKTIATLENKNKDLESRNTSLNNEVNRLNHVMRESTNEKNTVILENMRLKFAADKTSCTYNTMKKHMVSLTQIVQNINQLVNYSTQSAASK